MQDLTKVVTGKVRFSYAHVFEPWGMEGQDKKYSVCVMIPKTEKATLNQLKGAIQAAKEAGISKFGGKIPANLKLPLRDGDEERPDREEFEGMFFLNASSNRIPGVVDANMQTIIDPQEFYSGCWGRASLKFYAFSVSGNRGVAVGLNNLQKLEDDDNLMGGTTPDQDFAEAETLL